MLITYALVIQKAIKISYSKFRGPSFLKKQRGVGAVAKKHIPQKHVHHKNSRKTKVFLLGDLLLGWVVWILVKLDPVGSTVRYEMRGCVLGQCSTL